jgi:pimeloyl-ACP methyl ester carboxylesterase
LIFFPWFLKEENYRLSLDLPEPKMKQPFVLDLLRTTEEAQTAYRAAFLYPSKERVQEIKTPTFFLNYQGDPIGSHPQRLEVTPDCIQIELLEDPDAVEARAREIFKEFSPAKVTIQPQAFVITEKITRPKGFVHTSFGPVFYSQEMGQSKINEKMHQTVVFLHDFGTSSNSTIEISKCCQGADRKLFVDLPGHGETGLTYLQDYTPNSMAKMLAEGLMQLNLGRIHLVSIGMSSSIAVELSLIDSLKVKQLSFLDPWFPNASQIDAMRDFYAPDLNPSEYGEHLMRAWYFARDSELYFPWYDTKNTNALKREPEIDPQATHRRAVDALKAGEELKQLARDLIGYDVEANLQDIPLNTKVYAWTGNGRESFAERIHEAISSSKLYYLPESRSQWSINLLD